MLPALLIRSDDPLHPTEISDLYAEHLPDCRVLPSSTPDVAAAIGAFCDEIFRPVQAGMRTFIALFRGINVGGKNKLPMKELACLMESMGLKNVSTYIQSGNVVFQTAGPRDSGLAGKIQVLVLESFGFSPEVIILDKSAIDKAISANPFSEADSEPKSVHLTFLSELPGNPDLEALESVRTPNERFVLKGKVFYLHAPDGIGRSKLAARIEKSLGVSGTSRNWRTVLKLQEMTQSSA